jgi:hypothetical protein
MRKKISDETISYEGVVFTRGAIRLHRAADNSLRRFAGAIMRVRIEKIYSVSVL